MNKGIFSLLFIALFASAQCEKFMRIPFENGKVSSRSLAELNKAAFTTLHPNNTAAAVVFPDNFKTLNKIAADTVTDMLIVLWTPYSGIFTNYDKDFTSLVCDTATCATTAGNTYTKGNMNFYTGGNLGNIKMQVKSGDNVAWELQDQLTIVSTNSVAQTTQQFPKYVISPGAYGFIGLGTDKGADKNFKTDLPIFSIKTSRTRTGSIIFGNDGTTKNPVKLTADKNWRVSFDSAVVGALTAKPASSWVGVISFDVNVDGLAMNADLYTPICNQFINPTLKYKMTYESDVAKKPFGQYDYSFSGSLSDLPDISIKSGDKELFKIPPTVYMRYDNNLKKFGLLFSLTAFASQTDDSGKTINVTPLILGNQFMAQYYTVFEVTKDGPTVTLNEAPLNDWPSSSGSSGGSKGWIIGVVAVVGLAAVGYIVFKNKAANKLSEHLNPK